MRENRMLRSTWRELETWNSRDYAMLTPANESAGVQENRIGPKPARQFSTLLNGSQQCQVAEECFPLRAAGNRKNITPNSAANRIQASL